MRNFLTFDIEEWYHVNYEGVSTTEFRGTRTSLPALVDRLLQAMDSAGATGTFFCLGSVAEMYPEAVRRISAAGHEVASHGYAHEAVHSMTPSAFREDLKRSCDILEQVSGQKVLGFRAPSFSVTADTLRWYYDELEAAGLAYSSSVFCGRTFLYGIPNFPYQTHRPSGEGWNTSIIEIPVTRIGAGRATTPVYFRLFPAWVLRQVVTSENRNGRGAVFYIHPREIDPEQPRLSLAPVTAFIHYFGVAGCEKKVRSLLTMENGNFSSFRDALREGIPAGSSLSLAATHV